MSAVAVIDVGNTSVSLGLYENGKISRVCRVPGSLTKDPKGCVRALRSVASKKNLSGAMLATVVPSELQGWRGLVRDTLDLPLRQLTSKSALPLTIDYPKPKSIGADRLADAAGAVVRYGAPALICDFGTALTFDVVTPKRCYVGGAICPGLPLMSDYLYERTAKLPKLNFGGEVPELGRDTLSAMRLGAAIGYRGMVREITRHLQKTTGYKFKLVATGGYAEWALEGIDMDFIIDPTLTLFGIGVAFDYACKQR